MASDEDGTAYPSIGPPTRMDIEGRGTKGKLYLTLNAVRSWLCSSGASFVIGHALRFDAVHRILSNAAASSL